MKKEVKPRKCIKCGQPKASTEYYKRSGNTCKECAKEYQKIINAQKRQTAKKDFSEAILDNYRGHKWGGGAYVWLNGVQVMEGGLLIGQRGRDWWAEKIERHKKWLRRKRMKEEMVCQ